MYEKCSAASSAVPPTRCPSRTLPVRSLKRVRACTRESEKSVHERERGRESLLLGTVFKNGQGGPVECCVCCLLPPAWHHSRSNADTGELYLQLFGWILRSSDEGGAESSVYHIVDSIDIEMEASSEIDMVEHLQPVVDR